MDKIISYVKEQIMFFQTNSINPTGINQSMWYIEIIEDYITSEIYSRYQKKKRKKNVIIIIFFFSLLLLLIIIIFHF